MNSYKYILIILFVCYNFLAISQDKYTVSGFVRDSLSNEPVVGASIYTSNINYTHTNEYGFFSLNVAPNIKKLSIYNIGFNLKSINIELDSNLDLNILLLPQKNLLNEIVVNAEKNSFVTTESLGNYSINSENLNYIPSFMGEKDIFKYFQILPGVNGGRDGISGMNIRGGSTDQTLILLDDIPIYNSAHAFGFVSVFSGEYIKSAQLYKGYIPSQYGGRLSGVATMNIREGNRNEHKQVVQMGTTTASGNLEGPINGGRGAYLVGARAFVPYLLMQGVSMFVKGTMSTLPVIGFYDITAKVCYDLTKKSTIYANFYTGKDAFDFYFNDNGANNLTSHSNIKVNWGNIVGSLRFSSSISNKSFLNITAYYSNLSNLRINGYSNSSGTKQSTDTRSLLEDTGIRINLRHNIANWYNLNYGLNISYQYFNPQNVITKKNGVFSEKNYNTRGLFTNSIYMDNTFILNNFRINIGGRVSSYLNNMEPITIVEPRASATYYTTKGSVWASYTHNSQPLFSVSNVINTITIPIDYWLPYQEREELPVSKQLSIGYKHNFNKSIEMQVEAYYKKSNNLSIVYDVSDFLIDEGGYKIGKGESYGLELMAQYKYNRVNFMTSYTYSKSLLHIDNRTVDFMYDTPHNLNLYSSYQTVRRISKEHTFSIKLNYKSGIPFALSNVSYPTVDKNLFWGEELVDFPKYPSTRFPNYFRLDLNYTMEKKLKKGSRVWQISILNATAHKNPFTVYTKRDYREISGTYGEMTKLKGVIIIPFLPSFSYTRNF